MTADPFEILEAKVAAAAEAIQRLRSERLGLAARIRNLEVRLEDSRRELERLQDLGRQDRLQAIRLAKIEAERDAVRERLELLLKKLEGLSLTAEGED